MANANRPANHSTGWFFTGLVLGITLGGFFVWLLINYYPFSGDLSGQKRDSWEDQLFSDKVTDPSRKSWASSTDDTSALHADASDSTSPADSLEIFSFLDTVDWGSLDSLGGYNADSLITGWFRAREKKDSAQNQASTLIPKDVRTVRGNPEVKRDQLLFVRSVPVFELLTDSLGKVSRRVAADSPFKVDFWRSPVNYKGYRKTGRNLVVYGIYEADSIELLRSGHSLFLDIMDDRYLITETYDFKHLVEVSTKRRVP